MPGQKTVVRIAPPMLAVLTLAAAAGLAAGAPPPVGPTEPPSPIRECATAAARRATLPPGHGPGTPRPGSSWRLAASLVADGTLAGWELTTFAPDGKRATLWLPPESAVQGPVEGLIAVADDDGQRSVIRLVSPADGCAETVFQGDLVVRRVALEPAGRGVLFHGVGRSDRADLGTWRLVPGSGAAAVQILRPLSASDPIVRAIGRIWSTELRASHDGTQLAVQSCGASKCRTRVADLQTGAVRGLDDPEQSDLIGIDGTRAVTFNACTGLPCRLVATELDTGRQVVLAEAATSAATTMVDGRLVVAVTLAEHGAIGSMVIDAATGRSWPLATPAPGMTFLQFGGSATAGVEVPPGWVGAAGDARTGPLAIDPTQVLSTPTTEESR